MMVVTQDTQLNNTERILMLCYAKWKSIYILQIFSDHLPRSKGGLFLLLDLFFFSLMTQDLIDAGLKLLYDPVYFKFEFLLL